MIHADDARFYSALGTMLERSITALIEATPAVGDPKGSAGRPLCSPCSWRRCSRPSRASSLYCPEHETEFAYAR